MEREIDKQKTAMKVSWITIAANFVLSAFKLAAGIIAKSGAMVSDAVHSASDVLSTFVVMAGVKISGKKADDSHPYGHERMECVASMFLAAILAVTGIGIGISGINKITGGGELTVPGVLALVAAAISIMVKEVMFWYTRHYAKKLNSGALMADAWHHRSDALSSVGSLIGIGGALLGVPILDPIASVVICLFIIKAAFDIAKDAFDKMVDKSCDSDTVEKMKESVLQVEGVKRVDDIKTRLFGDRIYIEAEISCDGNLTLYKSHDIAEQVHDKLEEAFPAVKHCTVHVNPFEE